MLHLPDVAELVHDEVVWSVHATQEDDPVERVPVEASKPREAEEKRGHEHPNLLDPHRAWVPVEPIEPPFGAHHSSVQDRGQAPGGGCSSISASWPPMS